jgi:hypothetical protein
MVLPGCSGSASGDPIPAAARIHGIRAIYFDRASREKFEFDVPSAHWEPILSALRPARRDTEPAKWVVLGELRITMKDGRPFLVNLFSVPEGEGAFLAGPNVEERIYYRGGKTFALLEALEAARSATLPDSG